MDGGVRETLWKYVGRHTTKLIKRQEVAYYGSIYKGPAYCDEQNDWGVDARLYLSEYEKHY